MIYYAYFMTIFSFGGWQIVVGDVNKVEK